MTSKYVRNIFSHSRIYLYIHLDNYKDRSIPFRVNLIPLVHLFDYDSARNIIWNVVGNMVMFIPSGIILPVVYKKLNSFNKVVAAGAFISLCIEILQLPFASRATDIDDLILNTLGVAVGYGIYAAAKCLKR